MSSKQKWMIVCKTMCCLALLANAGTASAQIWEKLKDTVKDKVVQEVQKRVSGPSKSQSQTPQGSAGEPQFPTSKSPVSLNTTAHPEARGGQPASKPYAPEARITFVNGVKVEIGNIEIAQQGGPGLSFPPGTSPATPIRFYARDCLERDNCLALEQDGMWTMLDFATVSELKVELEPNVRSPMRAPEGVKTFGGNPVFYIDGKILTAYKYLHSHSRSLEMYDTRVTVKLADGSEVSGRWPSGTLSDYFPSARITGMRRVLQNEIETSINTLMLKRLACSNGSCNVEYFTNSDFGDTSIRGVYPKEPRTEVLKTTLTRVRLRDACCSQVAPTLPFGSNGIIFRTEEGGGGIAEHNLERIDFVADAKRRVYRTGEKGVFTDEVHFEQVPANIRLRSGESSQVSLENETMIRGWTADGRMLATNIVGIAGQRIVQSIEFLRGNAR